MQKLLNSTTLSEGITSSLNCLDDSIKPPKEDKLISIEWFKIRETDFRDKIFKFEFGNKRLSHYKKSLKSRTIFYNEEPLSLKFSNSSMEDGGLYECVLKHSENGKESYFKNYISLNVPHAPTAVYIEDMEGATVRGVYLDVTEGDKIVLTCIAFNGFPKPTIQWQLDNKIIRGTISNVIDKSNIKKPKVSSTIDSMVADSELSGGKLTCRIIQDLSDDEKHSFVNQRTIILRVKQSEHTKQKNSFTQRELISRKELYSFPKRSENHSVKNFNSTSESFDSSNTGRLRSHSVAMNTSIQASNITYVNRGANNIDPAAPALRKLLLEITRNIFIITIMFIIIIVLLVCLYAVSQCEKAIRSDTITNIRVDEGSDYGHSASNDSTYQATNTIIN